MVILQKFSDARSYGAMVGEGFDLRDRRPVIYEAPIRIAAGSSCQNGVSIGAYTFMGLVHINAKSVIGRFCSIARGVVIGALPHPMTWLSTSSFQYAPKKFGFYDRKEEPRTVRTKANDPSRRQGPVIGHDVWLGTNAIILNDVRIGHGAVVAAGAVVSKDVPPYAVVAGVPAKVVKYRFDSDTIKRLLALGWWNCNVVDAQIPYHSVSAAASTIEAIIDAGNITTFRPRKFSLERRDNQLIINEMEMVPSVA